MKSVMNNQTFYLPKNILRPCGIDATSMVEEKEIVVLPAEAKATTKKTTTTAKKDKAE